MTEALSHVVQCHAKQSATWIVARVTSLSPATFQSIDDPKLTLTERHNVDIPPIFLRENTCVCECAFCMIDDSLKVGDEVYLMANAGLQRYLVVGIKTKKD